MQFNLHFISFFKRYSEYCLTFVIIIIIII